MPQHDPQPPVVGPAGERVAPACLRRRALASAFLGAVLITAGLQAPLAEGATAQTAGAQTAGAQTPEAQTPRDSTPEPAPVPQPPEQSSDDKALIELPIAPAAAAPEEPKDTAAPVAHAPDGGAGLPHDALAPFALRVLFPADESHIDTAAESELVRLAGYLNENKAQRVVLEAHAGDNGQGESEARRLALSRALAVRTFLVDRGVPFDRILLRPLGNKLEDGPPDRVDILPLRP